MGRPLRKEYPGAFYHVTARGNEQQEIYELLKDDALRGEIELVCQGLEIVNVST